MRRFWLTLTLAVAALAITPSSALGAGGWSWPLEGDVITPFAQSSDPYASGDHRGIDIEAADGTAVVAPIRGKVRWTGTLGSGGKMVSVTSSSGLHVLSFLHLSAISVARGQAIVPGSKLGLSGSSGDLRGKPPHLHFGVRVAEGEKLRYVDPLSLLSTSGKAAVLLPPRASAQRKRRPVRTQRHAERPVRQPSVQLPAEQPAQQRSIRPAATEAERVRTVDTTKRGQLERERAVEPVLAPRQITPAVSMSPPLTSEAHKANARASRVTALFVATFALAALGAAALWWWRRWTVAPVLPAQPPSIARLRIVDQPPQAPARKAL